MRKNFEQEDYFKGQTDEKVRIKIRKRYSDMKPKRMKDKDTDKKGRIVVEDMNLEENKSDINKSLQNQPNIKDDKSFITIWDGQPTDAATARQDFKIYPEDYNGMYHSLVSSIIDTEEIPTDLLAEMSRLSIASSENDEDPNKPSSSKKPRTLKTSDIENRILLNKLEALEKSNPWIDQALMETNIKVAKALEYTFYDLSGDTPEKITPEDTEGLTKWVRIFKEILVEKFVTNPLPGYKTSIISDKSSFGIGGIFYVVENEGKANETIFWGYPFLRILTEDGKVDVGQMEVFFKHILETIPDKERPNCQYFEFAAPDGILTFLLLQWLTTLNDGDASIMRQHPSAIEKLNNIFDGCFIDANEWFKGYRYSRDDLEKLKELMYGIVLPAFRKFLPDVNLEDLNATEEFSASNDNSVMSFLMPVCFPDLSPANSPANSQPTLQPMMMEMVIMKFS
ncbi:hypothetical protein Ddc_14461 [Ditylenchus destructor]|nr:hypothetical protein Ddc_14461 [Ditylenchus destructor]